MMPIYTEYFSWKAHRQKRGLSTDLFISQPGFWVYIWIFGWVIYYTGEDSKYPPKTIPEFRPWRDGFKAILSYVFPTGAGMQKVKREPDVIPSQVQEEKPVPNRRAAIAHTKAMKITP